MILLFNEIINSLNKKDIDPSKQYKSAYEENILPDFDDRLPTEACPPQKKYKCGAIGSMEHHTKYKRAPIRDIVDDQIIEYIDVEISRVMCSRCNKTHALLLWFIPPYSRHTLRFIFTVLQTYYLKSISIEELCKKYDITYPTLYTWNNRYREQYDDLRKQFDPPLLPDVPLKYEQWGNNVGATIARSQNTQCDQPSLNTEAKAYKDELTTAPGQPDDEPKTYKTRPAMLTVFEVAVFMAIKAAIENDNSVLFKDFYASHRKSFFQNRQVKTSAGRARTRSRSP